MTAPQDPSEPGPWTQGQGRGSGASGPWQPPPSSPPPPPPPQGQWQPPPAYGQPAPPQGPYGQQPYQQGPSPYGQPPGGQLGAWQGPPLAGWGTRAGGYLIDALISLVVQTVVGLIDAGLGQLAGLAMAVYFGYLTGTTGQTPGRKAVGITVLREADGQHLGAGAGIGRAFLHILDALPLLLGFFWPIWDPKKQTFADKIIGSVVVKV